MLRGEVLAQAMVHEKKGAGLKVVKVTGALGGAGQSDREQLIDCVDLSGKNIVYFFKALFPPLLCYRFIKMISSLVLCILKLDCIIWLQAHSSDEEVRAIAAVVSEEVPYPVGTLTTPSVTELGGAEKTDLQSPNIILTPEPAVPLSLLSTAGLIRTTSTADVGQQQQQQTEHEKIIKWLWRNR